MPRVALQVPVAFPSASSTRLARSTAVGKNLSGSRYAHGKTGAWGSSVRARCVATSSSTARTTLFMGTSSPGDVSVSQTETLPARPGRRPGAARPGTLKFPCSSTGYGPPRTQPPAINPPPARRHSRARSASLSSHARRMASCSAGDIEQPGSLPAKRIPARIPARTWLNGWAPWGPLRRVQIDR